MKRNKLMLSILAAAALGAFGTVNAHDVSSSSEASADPTLTTPADSSLGSDSSMSSSASIGSSGDESASSGASSEAISSLPSGSDMIPSASVDSFTDEERLSAQGGVEQVAGAFEQYAPETGTAEERQRN